MVEYMHDCMRSREGGGGREKGRKKKKWGEGKGEAADNKSRRNGYIRTEIG